MVLPKPVPIRGVIYKSQAEAAEKLGVPQSAISSAMLRGTLDNVGLGRNLNTKHPIIMDGVPYESQGAAAKAMGVDCRLLNSRCRHFRKQGVTKFQWKGRTFDMEKKK